MINLLFWLSVLSEAFLLDGGDNVVPAGMNQGIEGQVGDKKKKNMCPAAQEGSCKLCVGSSLRKSNLSQTKYFITAVYLFVSATAEYLSTCV